VYKPALRRVTLSSSLILKTEKWPDVAYHDVRDSAMKTKNEKQTESLNKIS
jgi:hypothetical protein